MLSVQNDPHNSFKAYEPYDIPLYVSYMYICMHDQKAAYLKLGLSNVLK